VNSNTVAIALAIIAAMGNGTACWQFAGKLAFEHQAKSCGQSFVGLANAVAKERTERTP